MPELPEVETVVRGLRRSLTGQNINNVEVLWERTIDRPVPDEFRSRLLNRRITAVARRGKFIILHLNEGDWLVHLRMTGQLLVMPRDDQSQPRHTRVVIACDSKRLLFVDMRKFGRMYWVPDAAAMLSSLGPEPLEEGFSSDVLAASLSRRRMPIKSLLLDQRVVAGIGNIYADEALFTAGIAPERMGCTLTPAEVGVLFSAIRVELQRGIQNRGTTLSDYRDADGRRGDHHAHLRVYGRGEQPCLRCGARIVRSRVGGRSSYHCPNCQA